MNPDDLDPDWRDLYEERAAIRQWDGGASKEEAEREAMKEILANPLFQVKPQ